MMTAKMLRHRIDQLAPREPIIVGNITREFSNINALDLAFHRFEKQGLVVRYKKGIYYKPQVSRLGNFGIDKEALIREKYLYPNGKINGYLTGPQIWNQWGLTTQIPRKQWIAVEGIRQQRYDKNLEVQLIKAKGQITQDAVSALQFLDTLQQMDLIQDETPERVITKLMKIYGERFTVKDRLIVLQQAENYSKEVQVLAGLVAEECIKDDPYFTALLDIMKGKIKTGKKVRIGCKPEIFAGNRTWGNYYASTSKQ